MPIFGVTASSNMSTKLTDFYQIATTTVGSTPVSEIVFSGIPSNYKHLQIRGISYSVVGADCYVQFNGDTANNYSHHQMRGSGGTPSSSANATAPGCWIGIDWSDNSQQIESRVIDILDYANTNKFKTTRTMHTSANNTSTEWLEFTSGHWRSTSAITSIRIHASTQTFKQYTSFALYGITG